MCLKFSNARRDRARKDDNGDTRPGGSSLAVRMIAEVIAYHNTRRALYAARQSIRRNVNYRLLPPAMYASVAFELFSVD